MDDARSEILARVRGALGRGGRGRETDAATAAAEAAVAARLATPVRGLVPARGRPAPSARLATFVAMAEEAAATVATVARFDAVAQAVARYLCARELGREVRVAPAPALTALGWAATDPPLAASFGPARAEDRVSVTPALAGVAETGTLVLASGPETPATLSYLPETHIVVLAAAAVVGCTEDALDRLRAERTGPDGAVAWPRTFGLITGPSRTGDIEQRIELGAHGPRRLHIVLIDPSVPSSLPSSPGSLADGRADRG